MTRFILAAVALLALATCTDCEISVFDPWFDQDHPSEVA